MTIQILKLGKLYTNCYMLHENKKVIIIDPACNAKKIIEQIGDKEVVGIIITHHHFDHVGAVDELVNKYKVKVYDKENLNEGIYNIAGFKFEIIYTPGHSDDSITIYFKEEKNMFVGDFIFKNSVGRTDLPTGNDEELKKSIKKIKLYSDITIYPGHGDITTIDYEKKYNYYFQ